MARPIVGSASELSGVLKDLFRQIDDGSISLFNLRAFVEHRDPFDRLVNLDWQKTYEVLCMSEEYAEFAKTQSVKEDPNLWIVPVIKGITCNKVVSVLRRAGVDVSLYVDDLDKDVTTNDRDQNRDGSYAIGFHRTIEADEENKNLSANKLAKRNHKGITLLERLLLELGYFLTTGRHLDEKNWTLCAGSRHSGGHVPRVRWDSGDRGVDVCWSSPDDSRACLRSRSAVLPA